MNGNVCASIQDRMIKKIAIRIYLRTPSIVRSPASRELSIDDKRTRACGSYTHSTRIPRGTVESRVPAMDPIDLWSLVACQSSRSR